MLGGVSKSEEEARSRTHPGSPFGADCSNQCWSREWGVTETLTLVWGSQGVAGKSSSSLEKFLFNNAGRMCYHTAGRSESREISNTWT